MEFASQGAIVAIADMNYHGAVRVVKNIQEQGCQALAVEVDLTYQKQIMEATAKVLEHFSTIDILINCAGWSCFKAAHEFTVEEWEKLRTVNLDGPWHFCQAVMPEMMKKRRGKIVNIGSIASIQAIPKAAPYSIAKHGIAGLTRTLAVDLSPYNINVNCICPGPVETPLLIKATKPEFMKRSAERSPLGLGKPSDIAKAAVFLSSSDSDWITGVLLPVDGGVTACIRAHHYE